MDPEELRAVSYLDVDNVAGRIVNLLPLWDGKHWHHWFPGPDGLIETGPIEAVETDYVAKERARDSDISIQYIEFMWQRASWPGVYEYIKALSDDFHNLGTSIAKLRHFHTVRNSLDGTATSRFVATELEYIVMVTRSVFDLLQETISEMWNTKVTLLDEEAEARRKAQKLSPKFSKLVLREKRVLKTSKEIAVDTGIPHTIAKAYADQGAFFSNLRDTRNGVVHHGNWAPYIYSTEKGFCVDPAERMFSRFDCWDREHHYNDRLVALTPWIAHLIDRTIKACNSLVEAFAEVVKFPKEIAPGYRVFVRGHDTGFLAAMLGVLSGDSPWWD